MGKATPGFMTNLTGCSRKRHAAATTGDVKDRRLRQPQTGKTLGRENENECASEREKGLDAIDYRL